VVLDATWDGPAEGLQARLRWAVTNGGAEPVRLRSVAVELGLTTNGLVRVWRHGYQSWSPTGVAVLGEDRDPSAAGGAEMLRAAHHSDQRIVDSPTQLRSEWVTVLTDEDGEAVLLGFEGSGRHDGCFRVDVGPDGAASTLVEAFIDADLSSGQTLDLDDVIAMTGPEGGVDALLETWADRVGSSGSARTTAGYQVGWCSWYHYFHRVSDAGLAANLALARQWPFEVFQVDDGYQAGIGDWLHTNDRFPGGVRAMADSIRNHGLRAGIWLAPFLVAPDSEVAGTRPDWLARWSGDGRPLHVWFSPPWGGGRGGLMYCLDTTRPDVLAHLEETAGRLTGAGFDYLKLDFTFAPAAEGTWSDPGVTPAQRVRAGFEAIRRGTGPEAFLLGCGVPLAHVVGVVDAVRIGQDVAPLWSLDPAEEAVPGYLSTQPATLHALASTLGRSFMHRRLWLNDPDCLMLRQTSTELAPTAARTWARVVGLSGGMALVSDDLALLGDDARDLLGRVLTLGRACDAEARLGRTPLVVDRMTAAVPTRMAAGGRSLNVDARSGASEWT